MIQAAQHVRAIAAIMVVYYHASFAALRLGAGALTPIDRAGAYGVDIFFVLSGFIMWVATSETATPGAFLRRRFLRIAPLYWLITLVTLAAIALAPSLRNAGEINLPAILASFAFVPWPFPGEPERLWPIVVPGWSLNYELFFYLIFAACLGLSRVKRLSAIVLAFTLLVAVGIATRPWLAPQLRFYTDPIILEFPAGVALGALYMAGRRLPQLASALLVAGGAAALALLTPFANDETRLWCAGIPGLAILGGAVLGQRPLLQRAETLRFLGDASYSLYLIQFLTLPAVEKLWRMLALPVEGAAHVAFIAIQMIVAIFAGLACYLAVERPLRGWVERRPRVTDAGRSTTDSPAGIPAIDEQAPPARSE